MRALVTLPADEANDIITSVVASLERAVSIPMREDESPKT